MHSVTVGPCRFERMAANASRLSRPRQVLLGILLDATVPMTASGRPGLRPIWVNEAIQRAYNLIQLTARLDARAPLHPVDQREEWAERRIARELASVFRSLDVDDDDDVMPCSDSLRLAIRDLIGLFAPLAGQASCRTRIERLSLPAFKRRAFILAACEMVVDVLRSAPPRSRTVPIGVGLRQTVPRHMRLTVSAGQIALPRGNSYQPSDTLFDLAALLGGDPPRYGCRRGGLVAELTVPIGRPSCVDVPLPYGPEFRRS